MKGQTRAKTPDTGQTLKKETVVFTKPKLLVYIIRSEKLVDPIHTLQKTIKPKKGNKAPNFNFQLLQPQISSASNFLNSELLQLQSSSTSKFFNFKIH